MDKKKINGKTLLTAAEIIFKAGEQIMALMEVLGEKLINIHPDKEVKIYFKKGAEDSDESFGGWLCKSWIQDFEIWERRKKKPYWHVAVKVIIYDEKETQIPEWEPSLYIMFGGGEYPWELNDFLLSDLLEKGGHLDGEHLWRWIDEGEKNWGFVVPLVKLNCEGDLVHQIVEPVQKLIENDNPSIAFPKDSIAFCFVVEDGGNLRINVPC